MFHLTLTQLTFALPREKVSSERSKLWSEDEEHITRNSFVFAVGPAAATWLLQNLCVDCTKYFAAFYFLR